MLQVLLVLLQDYSITLLAISCSLRLRFLDYNASYSATSKGVFSCWMMIALEKPAMWASAASWSLGLGIASNAGFWDSGVQEQQQSSKAAGAT